MELPSLVGNREEGAIGERSDGGAKPGRGGVSNFFTDNILLTPPLNPLPYKGGEL